MKKRLVRLRNKDTGETDTYPTIAELVRRNGTDTLGIGLAALYNAICNNNGKWSNKKYEVYYEDIEINDTVW